MDGLERPVRLLLEEIVIGGLTGRVVNFRVELDVALLALVRVVHAVPSGHVEVARDVVHQRPRAGSRHHLDYRGGNGVLHVIGDVAVLSLEPAHGAVDEPLLDQPGDLRPKGRVLEFAHVQTTAQVRRS